MASVVALMSAVRKSAGLRRGLSLIVLVGLQFALLACSTPEDGTARTRVQMSERAAQKVLPAAMKAIGGSSCIGSLFI